MTKIEVLIAAVVTGLVCLVSYVGYRTYDQMDTIEHRMEDKLQVTPTDVYNLVKEEQHIRATLEGAGIAVIEANREHRIVGWDNMATSLWGYTKQEAMQMHVEDLMDQDLAFDHVAKYNDGVSRNTGEGHILTCDSALHKDGEYFSVLLNIRAKDGRVVALAQKPIPVK